MSRLGKLPRVLAVVLSLFRLNVGVASAQSSFKVSYFSNANTPGLPDATLRMTNPGLTYAPICAKIYVFDADQQMSECCGCVLTPEGLRTLSVNNDLTANPLTGVKPINGTINIFATLPSVSGCDPSSNFPKETLDFNFTKVEIQYVPQTTTPYFLTEDAASSSPLGTTEQAALVIQCSFIHTLGSGQGICTCGSGD